MGPAQGYFLCCFILTKEKGHPEFGCPLQLVDAQRVRKKSSDFSLSGITLFNNSLARESYEIKILGVPKIHL
jgi:hypothetical protein|tara:strand:+ start:465 stop:680 length:216 start_codon:yes stop_codon:yes gene_type:complete